MARRSSGVWHPVTPHRSHCSYPSPMAMGCGSSISTRTTTHSRLTAPRTAPGSGGSGSRSKPWRSAAVCLSAITSRRWRRMSACAATRREATRGRAPGSTSTEDDDQMNGTIRDRMHGEREGFALTAAVIALVLVGALVTGGFFAASQENRITDSSHYAERALLVAEYGANDAAGTQRTETLNALPLHTSVTYKLPVDAGPGVDDTALVEIRRMQGDVGDPTGLFFIRSTGRVYGGRPRRSDEPRPERSVAILVRTSTFDFHHHAALVSLNPTEIKGYARVPVPHAESDRCDESACPSTNKGSVPGVIAKSEGDVTYKKGDAVTGNPAVFEDPYMTPADFLVFGDWTYEELAARATKVFPHGSNPKPSPSLTADGLC